MRMNMTHCGLSHQEAALDGLMSGFSIWTLARILAAIGFSEKAVSAVPMRNATSTTKKDQKVAELGRTDMLYRDWRCERIYDCGTILYVPM